MAWLGLNIPIYIYISRERERERERDTYMYSYCVILYVISYNMFLHGRAKCGRRRSCCPYNI